MSLPIFPSTSEQREQIFIKTLFNNTDRVTKIADQSVVNAINKGIAKISGKAEKDIILALTTLFPDNTYGENLDECAKQLGIAVRFGASQSSTYLRLVADPNTVYTQGVQTFSGSDGILFELEDTITIGEFGFSYAKVRSIDIGNKCNVLPLTINVCSPTPSGHKYVVNEYMAIGGRDNEDDQTFRIRIKEGVNILATGTIAMLEQVFMKINNNVLRIFYQGINEDSQVKIAIVTQNGIDLNQSELDDLLQRGSEFFTLTTLKPYGTQSYGVYLKNIEWQPLDISFRADFFSNFNIDNVRKEIQIKIAKYLDFRTWQSNSTKVEWDNLLEIVKNTPGVKYVPDQYFYPNNDQAVDKNKLPRLRGFLILNLQGQVVSDLQGILMPEYFPQVADFSYQQTVLQTI